MKTEHRVLYSCIVTGSLSDAGSRVPSLQLFVHCPPQAVSYRAEATWLLVQYKKRFVTRLGAVCAEELKRIEGEGKGTVRTTHTACIHGARVAHESCQHDRCACEQLQSACPSASALVQRASINCHKEAGAEV
jgi:hypothetical protein